MLLKEVHLHNIRSYRDETIVFPAGSSLLSGDIGSGKSTILLAVEFALFGASRTDLPAESLLRKGAVQGSVELKFLLEGKEIIIKRGLKKEKETVRQIAGHIIADDLKRELTPLELKAEILHLLGYPEEFLTKTRNYLFQYTVYTPQEEMKSILQEDSEIRLDTLRKLFNLDKYKIIRDNTQSYLRYLREQMRILETRLEPRDELKRQHQKIKDEKAAVEESLQSLAPKLEEVQAKVQQQQQQADRLEYEQQQYQELSQQCATVLAILQERQAQLQQSRQQSGLLQKEEAQLTLPEGANLVMVKQEQQEWQQRRQELLTRSTLLRERITKTEALLQDAQQEAGRLTGLLETLPEKQQVIARLQAELLSRPALQDQQKQAEEALLELSEIITKDETLLKHSQDLVAKITSLDSCPLCLQEVSPGHKHQIAEREGAKLQSAEKRLAEYREKRRERILERAALQEEKGELAKKELRLEKMKMEQQQLKEQQQVIEKKKEQAAFLIRDREHLGTELQQLKEKETMERISARLHALQALQEILTRKQFLASRLQEGLGQQAQLQEQISALTEQLGTIQKKLPERKDQATQLKETKTALSHLLHLEKSLEVQQGQLQTQFRLAGQQQQQLDDALEKIGEHARALQRRKELYHWLEEFFLGLTYTLEKQVLGRIHALFSRMFQEWFSILIDDEGIFSRVDDTFQPVIEQNGYEIPFSMLSGGEKTSASLAYRLALNRVINDVIHHIKTKDLLILDEPTDGFSSEQLDKVREVLEKLNLAQIIIVSHEAKIESFVEKVIQIRKEGQMSRVITTG